jgi:Flp pilus assembly protein TadD
MPLPTDEREISLQKTEHTYVKLTLGIIGGLCLLVAICWGGHRLYVHWQERKLMRQAHVAFDKGDFRWASLATQRAYSVDPTSIDACRTLANIAEKENNPEAIEWRRRATEVAPTSFADRLALARTALRFQQSEIAARALARVPAPQRQNADYESAAAHLALLQDNMPAAGEHLREAVRLAPNDPHRKVELAEFELRSENRAEHDQGQTLATQLLSNPHARLDAFHILIDDAIRRTDDSASIELAKELDAVPDAPMDDRLLALGILRTFKDPAFSDALSRLEAQSTKSSDRAVKLISWMNSHGLALLAIDWSRQLPNKMLNSVGMRFALADSYVQLRDWKSLRALLQRGSWDRAESLRLALQAKVARETGDDASFERSWAAAVNAAGDDPERLKALEALAFQWNWSAKAVDLLWTMANNRENEKEALQTLYNFYAKERDTSGLYRTLTRLVEVMPNDLTVRNNFAQISLLLKAEPARALAIAREVHEKQPQNPAFASTYAFGLFQTGDINGALKIMSQLSPAELQDPSIAAYYGVILAAAGRKTEAAHFLNEAKKASLLPEEEKLVTQARDIIVPPKPFSGHVSCFLINHGLRRCPLLA